MVLQIEILNDNALSFLKNLEQLKWISMKNNAVSATPKPRFSGRLSKKTAKNLHLQLKQMRDENT